MTDMMRIVTIGALLHDIGKAIYQGQRREEDPLSAWR